jgi:carbon storage regulator
VLILSRREGEEILLDGGIKIVVIQCDRRSVRIGIEAPPAVSIVRGEIVHQIADENRRAPASAAAAALLLGAAPPAAPDADAADPAG